MSLKKKYGFLWFTLLFFILSFAGHWIFAWFSYVNEQQETGESIAILTYLTKTLRDTLENWQSEFLQLMWQVAGLAFLLFIGSPQSKEEEERKEEKLDFILKKLDPENAERLIKELDARFPGR